MPLYPPAGSGTMAIGGAVTSGTTGSVLFVGAGPVLAQDNANLFWDDSNNRMGVGVNTGLTAKIQGTIGSATEIGLLLTAAAAQSANIVRIQNSTPATIAYITATGQIEAINFRTDIGTVNAFIGDGCGNTTLTGLANTAIGTNALAAVTTGNSNVAIGFEPLKNNLGGGSNFAIGQAALYTNTGGIGNFAVGVTSMKYHDSGDGNVCVGNTTMTGSVGAHTSGSQNTAIGNLVLSTVTANYNVAIGSQAGQIITTGAQNTLIGTFCGDALTTGSSNIAIGYNLDLPSNTSSNQMTIGNIIFGTTIDGTGTTVSTGKIGVGIATSLGARLHIKGNAAADVVLISQGVASQTGDLTEWQDSSGNVLAYATSGGAHVGPQSPKSFTITTDHFCIMTGELTLNGTEEITENGTAVLTVV